MAILTTLPEIMNSIQIIVSSLTGIIILVLTIWSIFSKKGARYLESFKIIESEIQKFMGEAEKITGLSGPEKKEYVIEKAKDYADSNNLKISGNDIDTIIESLIDFSKIVN